MTTGTQCGYTSMKKQLGTFAENIAESGAACLITMVQGNVLAMGVSHWIIASQTGLFAGAASVAALSVTRTNNRWVVAGVLGAVTAVVDYFMHPGMFGSAATEAIVTGIAAAALSLTAHTVARRLGAFRAAG